MNLFSYQIHSILNHTVYRYYSLSRGSLCIELIVLQNMHDGQKPHTFWTSSVPCSISLRQPLTMVSDSPPLPSRNDPTKKPTSGAKSPIQSKLTTTIEIQMSIHSQGRLEKEDLGETEPQHHSYEGIEFERSSLSHAASTTALMSSFGEGEGDMMREADAEILERGFCDSSAPSTPKEPSIVGPLNPPSMNLGGCMIPPYKQTVHRRELECQHSEEEHTGDSDRDGVIRHKVDVGMDIDGQNEFRPSESGFADTRIPLERCPIEASILDEKLEAINQRSYHSVSLNSPLASVEQLQMTEAVDEAVESPCSVARGARPADYVEDENGNKTYHRRLHEAALFEKVVGEYPKNGIILIDDDDDASSSDDDDEDLVMNDKSAAVNHSEKVQHGIIKQAGILQSTSNTQPCPETKESGNIDEYLDPVRIKNSLLQHHMTLENGNSEHSRFLDSIHKEIWEDSDHTRFDAEEHRFDNSYKSLLELDDKRSSRASLPSKLQTRVQSEIHLNQLDISLSKNEEKDEVSGQLETRKRSKSFSFFRHHLPLNRDDGMNDRQNQNGHGYKGIRHNPPEVTKRGISRGNYAQLHRKAWLEVSDQRHRYGKNLRLYYKHWESLGHPTNMFFDWLDSKGEAEGWEKPSLIECHRSTLDHDRVLYITDLKEQEKYRLKIIPVDKDTVGSKSKIVDHNEKPVCTGPNGWIFVLRDHELYGSEKVVSSGQNQGCSTKFRFHHSSFFGGKAVAAAGILITDDKGYLKHIYPHSGHYRPGEAHMQRMLYYLYQRGTDLHSFEVDMQQIMHVSREKRDQATPHGSGGKEKAKKAKKTDSLCMKKAYDAAVFLGHKARSIENGMFSKIHKIRRIPTPSVRHILDIVDNGGCWTKRARI